MCVQGVDVQCVLQFTLIHAAGCALHRRTSRVIHRIELSSFVQVSTARATRAEVLRLDGARSFAFTVGTDRPETTVCWVRHLDWARARVQKWFLGGCDARPAFRRDCEAEAPSRPGPLWSGAAFKPDAFPSAQKVTRHPTVGPKPEGFAGECPLVRAARRPFRPAAVDLGSLAFRAKAAHFCGEPVSR